MTQTPFDTLSGSFQIQHGVATTKDLFLVASFFRADGVGSTNLINSVMDYRLLVSPFRQFKFKWDVPIMVTGSISDPIVQLDMLSLKSLLMKEEVSINSPVKTSEIQAIHHHASNALKQILGHQHVKSSHN